MTKKIYNFKKARHLSFHTEIERKREIDAMERGREEKAIVQEREREF